MKGHRFWGSVAALGTICSLGLTCFLNAAVAQTDIFVRGSGKLYPIAIPQLCLAVGEDDSVRSIPNTLTRDLTLSGYFEVLNPNSFLESPGKCSSSTSFAYSDWSIIGAEGLVKGEVSKVGDEIKVKMYLHDVQRREVVLGKEYEGHLSQAGQIAHRFANEIMKFFTGEYGVFGSKIAYSSKVGRFKELFIMDMDGSNIRQLTNDRGLASSASFDLPGNKLVYTSYRQRVPDLFQLDLSGRAVRQVTRDSNMQIGGKYSSDGSQILASRSIGKAANIVLYDAATGAISRTLTNVRGVIDVSPDWSPDYRSIAFCSDRSGKPQIYVMDATGANVKRISFATSNYCTSPAWSPKGDRIAYVCRADRGFQLFTARADGSDTLQLTSYGDNEDPAWSADGNYIVFATTFGKSDIFHLALMRADGSNLQQLTFGRTSDTEPTWGPVPGLG